MEEELDKQNIKADTDHFAVTGKGNIIESSLRGRGLWHWGYQLAACPWDAAEHPVSERPLLKARHLGSPGLTAIQCHKRWAESKLGGM